MALGPLARRTGFWALDALNGRPMRHHLDDIRARMEGGDEPGETAARLRAILDHATRTTSFYAPYAGGELATFPVIDRLTLRRGRAEFESSGYSGMEMREVSTSGTSGSPLTVRQDREKRRRSVADTIYFNDSFGQRVGDRLMWLRHWPPALAKPRYKQVLQNIVPVEVAGMDEVACEKIVDVLRRGQVNAILGYTTALWALARHIEHSGRGTASYGLRVIINDSEMLAPTVKSRLEAAFGCPVVDRYANNENGILAATSPYDARYRVNHASYRMEFLKLGGDEPAAPGTPARIVVTDLFNRAMPIIRYDTGDLAVVSLLPSDGEVLLERIEGRRADVVYDTDGTEVSASTVATVMYEFTEILQYQLVQEGARDYRLAVSGAEGAYQATAFVDTLTRILGTGAHIAVEFVDEVPRDRGGKSRPLVCRYQPPSRDRTG